MIIYIFNNMIKIFLLNIIYFIILYYNKMLSYYTNNICKSLKMINNYDTSHSNFDIVISGGGCSGYYYAGTFEIIKFLEKANKIKVNKIYAVSAGVLASLFYLCGIEPKEWIQSYYYAKENYKNNLHEIIIKTIKHFIPKNAHELCTGKLNIILSKLTFCGFRKEIFNKFDTFDELILIISAAINVPFIISNYYRGIKINNNYYYDGVFVENTPILFDNNFPQLVMKTHKIDYPLKNMFSINDKYIELLIIRGFIETDKFLNNTDSTNKFPLYWIDKNLKKKEKKNKCFYIVNILTIIAFYIYY